MGKPNSSKAESKSTYSSGSDRHAEHKHLFGTGNNSDFIINMTPEGAQKLCGIYSVIAMILIAVSAVPYYVMKAVEEPNEYRMLATDHNETVAFLIMALLILAGFVGLLIFMISCVKKEIIIERNKALMIFAGILVSALISTLSAEDVGTALFGYLDRAEGLITIIGYIGFFSIGMSLTAEKYRKTAVNAVVIIGTANAAVGIAQSIPALSEYIPSYYNYLFIDYKSNIEMAEYFNAYAGYDASYAADGLCCSPFALGALLTVSCALAVNNAAYARNVKKKILNLIAAGLMSAAAILTQTFPAMLGIACAIVIEFILVIAVRPKTHICEKCGGVILPENEFCTNCGESKSESGEKSAKTCGARSALTVVIAGVAAAAIFAGVFATGNFRMRNERIIYTDSLERLNISFYAHSESSDNIFSTLWYEGWLCFQDNALIGVGPDNWVTMYASGEGMETDRSYNEYLDTAITRGSIGALLYIAMLAITLTKAARMLKVLKGGKIDTVSMGLFAALTAYMIQAFFNISSASCTPFFYLVIGMIWSYEARGKLSAAKKKKSKR